MDQFVRESVDMSVRETLKPRGIKKTKTIHKLLSEFERTESCGEP